MDSDGEDLSRWIQIGFEKMDSVHPPATVSAQGSRMYLLNYHIFYPGTLRNMTSDPGREESYYWPIKLQGTQSPARSAGRASAIVRKGFPRESPEALLLNFLEFPGVRLREVRL